MTYFRASARSSAFRIPSLFRSNFSSTSVRRWIIGAAGAAEPAAEGHHFVAREFSVGVLVELLECRDGVFDFVRRDFTVGIRVECGEQRGRREDRNPAGRPGRGRRFADHSSAAVPTAACSQLPRRPRSRWPSSKVDDFAWKRPEEESVLNRESDRCPVRSASATLNQTPRRKFRPRWQHSDSLVDCTLHRDHILDQTQQAASLHVLRAAARAGTKRVKQAGQFGFATDRRLAFNHHQSLQPPRK